MTSTELSNSSASNSLEGAIISGRGLTAYEHTLGFRAELLRGGTVLNFGPGLTHLQQLAWGTPQDLRQARPRPEGRNPSASVHGGEIRPIRPEPPGELGRRQPTGARFGGDTRANGHSQMLS